MSWKAPLIQAREDGWDLSGSCGNDEQEAGLGYNILRIELIKCGFN